MRDTAYSIPPNEEQLAESLRIRLTWLSYLAYALCIERLLSRLGYSEIFFSNRRFLRGRTQSGGVDMRAKFKSELAETPVFIQLKRYNRTVSRRFVDELRATMLRYGTPQGVLITTSTFAKAAKDAVEQYPGRPIRLIDGKELGRLMLEARIGVSDMLDLTSGISRPTIDAESFEILERYCDGIRSEKQPNPLTN